MSLIIKPFKKLFSKLIPSIYLQDSSVRVRIYKWLLIGLLIRLSLMPIIIHGDLLKIYWRASLIAYHGKPGVGSGQLFIHYLHVLFLWVFKPLMPHFDEIITPELYTKTMAWFVSYPHIFRALFLFKLPYLIFDLGCAFILLHIFQSRKKGLGVFIFWMVNPIVIFATYMWGRYECIAVFFILLSLYYAKNNLFSKSLFCLGMSIITRWYPFILLPFFVVILGEKLWGQIKLAFWGLFPLGIITAWSKLVSRPSEIEQMTKIYHANYLFGMKFHLIHLQDYIFVFIVAYTFFLLYAYFETDHSFGNLQRSGCVVMLLFFATCFFHPQYFMWLIPFLTFQVVENRKFLTLFIIQVLCFIVYTFQWGSDTAGRFFTPISYSYFMHLHTPSQIINRYYPIANFIGIFRSIFSGVSLLMVYLILRKSFIRKKGIVL